MDSEDEFIDSEEEEVLEKKKNQDKKSFVMLLKLRKEKRKEKRLKKIQNRQKSWNENQKEKKMKRIENELKQKVCKTTQIEDEDSERRKIIDFFNEDDVIEEQPVLKVKKKKKESLDRKKSKEELKEKKESLEKKKSEDELKEKKESLEKKKSKEELKEKKEKKSLMRKPKTKFEEYLERDMNKGVVSAEEDLILEKRLAKKLKVKHGKLRGLDDEMNMLLDGMPSTFESVEDQQVSDGEDGAENLKKRRKKKKPSVEAEERMNEVDVDKESVEPESAKNDAVEAPPEEPSMDTHELTEDVKYIPPHLRSHARSESHEHTQFRRRIRGILNRLSESNVESSTEQISTIYRSIDRNTGCQILSEEIVESCSGGPRGNEQYAAVFAAFVAGMACSVGIDFGAKLIASLAKSFEDEYRKEDNLSLRNLTLLLSYLCIFGVCSSGLIYDFLNILSKRLMEIDVSTIVTILQCCGMKLRGDDPSAMKDFILTVQNRAIELKSSGSAPNGQFTTDSKRMEFMLETICDIKNNKKRAKEDPAHHTRIKKWLQKLRVEDILLRGLKWNKLLDPNKKGQWWQSGDIASTADTAKEVASTIDREVLETQKLLQLAAAQRMNTDTRRAIFCIIMSGEDYIDAFEKLLRLELSGKQDRDIMRVLLECCLKEKVFNKYYSVLACKLCSHDKNHKFTLQYCLWDHYKELESMDIIQSLNLARFTAEMLVSFSLSLAVLKPVDLSDLRQLTAKRIMHFRMLLEAIFEQPEATIWNIFTRAAVLPELEPVRNGLEFFIKQYVAGNNQNISEKFKKTRKAFNNVEGILK